MLDLGLEFSLLLIILFHACWDLFLLSLALHFFCKSSPVLVVNLKAVHPRFINCEVCLLLKIAFFVVWEGSVRL